MTEDHKFWLAIWSLLAAVACCLILTVGCCTAYTQKAFVDGDYVESVLPGSTLKLWVKAHPDAPAHD